MLAELVVAIVMIAFDDRFLGPLAPDQGWGPGSEGEDEMLAEYFVLRAERVTPAPKTLSFREAACLPCAALTA